MAGRPGTADDAAQGDSDVQDPERRGDDPATRDWLRAALLVVLLAIVVTAMLVWFALTVVSGPCCIAPPS